MDFGLSAEQDAILAMTAKLCADFDDAYWLAKDRTGGFPRLWRDACHIPWKLCAHFDSLAPHTRYRKYRGQDIV